MLACVPPDRVPEVWKAVRGSIAHALERGNVGTGVGQVEADLFNELAQLWVAPGGVAVTQITGHLEASGSRLPLPAGERDGVRGIGPSLDVVGRNPLTRSSPSARIDLSPSGRGKNRLGPRMRLFPLVGEVTGGRRTCTLIAFAGDYGKCVEYLPALEEFGRNEACSRFVILGRKGWKRRLADYCEPYVVLEKEL
jgi:hypothetical protein